MPLPKLETQKFTCIVPSTNDEIEYRPFLVKEEKILMMAQESNDQRALMRVLKDVINACTFDKLEVSQLTMFDVEFIFLQLRAKSVGETASLKFKCEECGEYTDIDINLLDVKVQYPTKELEKTIKLSKDVGITLAPISIDAVDNVDTENTEKAFTSGIAAVIDTVYDEDGVYKLDDFTDKEITEFIDSLNHQQLEKIQYFIENQPKLKHTVTWKCSACGHENSITIEGLQSFFT